MRKYKILPRVWVRINYTWYNSLLISYYLKNVLFDYFEITLYTHFVLNTHTKFHTNTMLFNIQSINSYIFCL